MKKLLLVIVCLLMAAYACADEADTYYSYLRDEISNGNLAVASVGTSSFTVTKHGGYIMPDKALGLVSADVRDYNGDGRDDLLTVELASFEHNGTFIHELEKLDGVTSTGTKADTGFTVKLYTLEGGNVVLKNSINVNGIYGPEWGKMYLSVQLYEGINYLSAYSAWEDETVGTNNYNPGMIFHADHEFCFVTDSLFGDISWGQHAFGINGKRVYGNENIDFTGTVIEYMREGKASRCLMTSAEINGRSLYVEAEDYTGMLTAIEAGRAAVKTNFNGDCSEDYAIYVTERDAKQQEIDNKNAEGAATVGAKADAIAEHIKNASGIGVKSSSHGYNARGEYDLTMKFSGGSVLVITIADDTCEVSKVDLRSGTYNNKSEWIKLKDTIIDSPEMNYSAYRMYKGDLNNCDDTKTVQGWWINCLSINDWIMIIRKA